MKNIFYITLLMFGALCNAQTVTLESMTQYEPGSYPNADYVKDSNGLLNKFIGTWKGIFEGKNYELNLIKKENVGEVEETKWDRLIGRLKITNSNGIIEFNNFSLPDNENYFRGHKFQKGLKRYMMLFTGNKSDCIDYGIVYIDIKPEFPNTLSIYFFPDYDIVKQNCSDFQTTIPTKKVIDLIKQ